MYDWVIVNFTRSRQVEEGSRPYSSEGVDVAPGEAEHGVLPSQHDPANDQVSENIYHVRNEDSRPKCHALTLISL